LPNRLDGVDLEGAAGEMRQDIGISRAPPTKGEAPADHDVRGTEARHEKALDEFLRRVAGEVAVEALYHHRIHSRRPQTFELARGRGEEPRRRIGREDLGRMRFEGERDGASPARRGTLARQLQKGLMTSVNAVEVSDGHRRAPQGRTDRLDLSENPHRRFRTPL